MLSLEIKISAEGDGFASSDQTVTKGDYVTLDATPNGLNLFIGWYNEKGELVSSEQNYSFVAKDNVSLVARFTTIKSFSVSKLPIKTEYTYKLDTAVDLTGIELEITYSDGTKQTVTDTSKMIASGYSAKPRGEKTITVEYEGLKADFKVKVKYTWWQWIIIILLGGWIWY